VSQYNEIQKNPAGNCSILITDHIEIDPNLPGPSTSPEPPITFPTQHISKRDHPSRLSIDMKVNKIQKIIRSGKKMFKDNVECVPHTVKEVKVLTCASSASVLRDICKCYIKRYICKCFERYQIVKKY